MHHALKSLMVVLALVVICGLPLNTFAADAININTATIAQLQNVKGVGAKTAEKIIAYREQHGEFKDVNELCKIRGIGDKSLKKMADQLCVE